jgi:hypothetical protein
MSSASLVHCASSGGIRARVWLCAALAASVLVAPGCRKKELFEVTGKVTFNGEAVSNGEIQLLPTDRSGPPAAGRIENGQYRLKSKAGEKRVSIRAARRTGQAVPGALGAAFEDYIPEQFNSASTLTAEVQPNDENHLDFELHTTGNR